MQASRAPLCRHLVFRRWKMRHVYRATLEAVREAHRAGRHLDITAAEIAAEEALTRLAMIVGLALSMRRMERRQAEEAAKYALVRGGE